MEADEFDVDKIGDMLEDDEISSWEEGFMRGYEEEDRRLEEATEIEEE